MELYIEKEFLDNFFLQYDDKPIQKVLRNIIKYYGDKTTYINYRKEEFEELMVVNRFFAELGNTLPPYPIDSIEDHLFSNSNFEQTLVFMAKKEGWFSNADKKGALCFSFDDYEQKIELIIKKLHFKIDLSAGFRGWNFLRSFNTLKFNHLMILDGYIIGDKDKQKMDKNCIPIIKNILTDKEKINVKVDILTKELNPLTDTPKHKKEKCKKVYKKLNREFANYQSKFTIVLNNFSRKFDFHDRTIATNYSLIDSGKGFNLIPYKASNSQVISETIFDKYTYYRLKRIKKEKKSYLEKLRDLETTEFKGFPENAF